MQVIPSAEPCPHATTANMLSERAVSALLPQTKYSARVLPGTYDVFYQGTSPSSLAPINPAAKLGCLEVP